MGVQIEASKLKYSNYDGADRSHKLFRFLRIKYIYKDPQNLCTAAQIETIDF